MSSGITVKYEETGITEDFLPDSFWEYRTFTFPSDNSYGYGGEKKRGKHNYCSDAKNEARWLRSGLAENCKYCDNPILLIHPGCDIDKYFHELVTNTYVIKRELGASHNNLSSFRITGNLDSEIKPFDIIKVLKKDKVFDIVPYYHVGVYLGNKQVFHFHDEYRKEGAKARVDSIETFWGGGNAHGHLIVYHPVVPFRNGEEATRNVAWAVDNGYGKSNYDKFHRNCEHLANTIVYGANHSEQTSEGTSFCLRSKIRQVNSELGELNNWRAREIQARIEIPPKSDCRIM